MPRKKHGKSSWLWYLLPVFFGRVGGVAGYFFLRRRDIDLAHKVLLAGVVVVIISMFLGFFLASQITGVFVTSQEADFEIVDVVCSEGQYVFTVRNNLASDVQSSIIDLQMDGSSVQADWGSGSVGSGQVVVGSLSAEGGTHRFTIADGSADDGVQVSC